MSFFGPEYAIRQGEDWHHEHDEVFIVTGGTVRFTSGDESVDAAAGTVVVVPIGVPHTFSNPFGQTATFIGTLTTDLCAVFFVT